MISHPGQAMNKMAHNRPVLASGDICLLRGILGIETITPRIYLLFRIKDLSANRGVLQGHWKATAGRAGCIICGTKCKTKMQDPGPDQGSHPFPEAYCHNSWLTGDPQGFQLPSCLPNTPWQWEVVGRGEPLHCPTLYSTQQAHHPAWYSPHLCLFLCFLPSHETLSSPGVHGQQ